MTKQELESILHRLVHMEGRSSHNKNVAVTESEIRSILNQVREVFASQPKFLDLHAPLEICGDIRGNLTELLRIFRYLCYPPSRNYIFLGGYLEGKSSLATILLLFSYKIYYPEVFFLLRGSTETIEGLKSNSFADELSKRFPPSTGAGKALSEAFLEVFEVMPVAALVADLVFCVHSGLPRRDLESLKDLDIPRSSSAASSDVVCDLLSAEPTFKLGWNQNRTDGPWTFGPDVLKQELETLLDGRAMAGHITMFCDKHKIDLVIRGHQPLKDGYQEVNDSDGRVRLVSIFSVPNFQRKLKNKGRVASISKENLDRLEYSFCIFKPRTRKHGERSDRKTKISCSYCDKE